MTATTGVVGAFASGVFLLDLELAFEDAQALVLRASAASGGRRRCDRIEAGFELLQARAQRFDLRAQRGFGSSRASVANGCRGKRRGEQPAG